MRWYGSCTDIHQQKATAEALREEYTITEQLHEVAKALATELDLSKVVQIITDAGTRITRAQFGAFFYNMLDEKGASYMLYTLSGVPRAAFDKFPMPRATQLFGPTFRGEGVIRADDIRKDPRFGKNAPYHGMPAGHLPVVSYLAVSVISRSGEVIGGLFFGHEEAGVFTERDEKIIVGVAAQAAAAMDAARLYQREQQARALAEQASQAKDHFLAALSHELRTPLTPVLAILSSLQQEAAIPEALAEDLETVRRNVELEARLIDDLLDLTRITRGKLELHCKQVTLGRLDRRRDQHLPARSQGEAPQAGARARAAPTQTIRADPARITQILWNLLKNSVKFTPDGGTITVRVADGKRRRSEAAVAAVVEVEDTGIGIEPDRIEHVFDAFEQGDRKITRQFGGLGLGSGDFQGDRRLAPGHADRHQRGSQTAARPSPCACRSMAAAAARDVPDDPRRPAPWLRWQPRRPPRRPVRRSASGRCASCSWKITPTPRRSSSACCAAWVTTSSTPTPSPARCASRKGRCAQPGSIS